MKKILLSLIAVILCGTSAAQTLRFAYVDADSALRAMPAYHEAQSQLIILRAQYEKEVQYNEQSFQRQFTEFLEGQKSFPESILLKRQRDLQDALEKSLAFRHDCDAMLKAAEEELLAPLRQRVQQAIDEEGRTGGYAMIFSVRPAYVNTAVCKDVTERVIKRLGNE